MEELPPAPKRPRRGSARRRSLVAIQVGVSVAAAAAAFHVSRSGADAVAVALTQTTTNGDVELRYPDGWRRTSADLAVTALGLDDPVVLARGRTGNSMLMAGLSPATGATLLPAAVLNRLDGSPQPTRVRLGARVAERYADLRLRGLTRPMTVFVVPTTEGALTLACLARAPEVAAVRSVCDRVAQSMLPTRGRAIAVGPSARYQEHLNALIGVLDATRVDRRTKLASAHTARRQAHLARGAERRLCRRARGRRARAGVAARGRCAPAHSRGDRRCQHRLRAARRGRPYRQPGKLRRRASLRSPTRSAACAPRSPRSRGWATRSERRGRRGDHEAPPGMRCPTAGARP